jgi:hypothetical protein
LRVKKGIVVTSKERKEANKQKRKDTIQEMENDWSLKPTTEKVKKINNTKRPGVVALKQSNKVQSKSSDDEGSIGSPLLADNDSSQYSQLKGDATPKEKSRTSSSSSSLSAESSSVIEKINYSIFTPGGSKHEKIISSVKGNKGKKAVVKSKGKVEPKPKGMKAISPTKVTLVVDTSPTKTKVTTGGPRRSPRGLHEEEEEEYEEILSSDPETYSSDSASSCRRILNRRRRIMYVTQ